MAAEPGGARDPAEDRAHRVASAVSEVLAPAWMVTGVLLLVGSTSSPVPWRGFLAAAVLALLVVGVPEAVLRRGVRTGRVGHHHLPRREDRPRFLAVALGAATLGVVAAVLLGAPRELFTVVVSVVAGLVVTLAISSVWKVSLHAACAAGSVAGLAVVMGPALLLASPLVLLVGWARLVLSAHTPAQVLWGAVVGAVVAVAVGRVLL